MKFGSFGERAYKIIREILFLRERLRPYIMEQMKIASRKGTPPMRPLFFDFADDQNCVDVDDQYLFGADLLVAPLFIPAGRNGKFICPPGRNGRMHGREKNSKADKRLLPPPHWKKFRCI